MSKPAIRTITNPTELLLAQLHEVRAGNTVTRQEIERLEKLLRGGIKEEARLEAKLNKVLLKHQQASNAVAGGSNELPV